MKKVQKKLRFRKETVLALGDVFGGSGATLTVGTTSTIVTSGGGGGGQGGGVSANNTVYDTTPVSHNDTVIHREVNG